MIHGIHSVIICNVIEVFFNSKTKKDEKTSMTLQINIGPLHVKVNKKKISQQEKIS